MPTKAESWEGIYNCLNLSAVCPQVQAFTGINMNEFTSVTDAYAVDFTEDKFLTVNVWSKDMNPETPKPVIFWIHGGGYASGSSGELKLYDGKNLADYGDVVFVSVNHRLNYLGYLDLSAYGEDFKYSGSAGHADLVMALEWVRDNIATFGGDPNNVTIEGQSAAHPSYATVAMLLHKDCLKRLLCSLGVTSHHEYNGESTRE
jgi:para-nitrobenzyl esterase